MKLTAIRAADVGRFADPVAIEGIADGVNVFAGENEIGKSTLFRALQAAFNVKYDGKGREIAILQPYTGGSPLIEVDFVAGDKPWRIRKRFLKSPLAELINLDTGAVIAKNADVQAKLDALRAGPGGLERYGVLWVAQGDSLANFALSPAATTTMRQAIQHELEGASADEPARRVHDKVLRRLAELLTPKAARATGEYADAIAAEAAAQIRNHDAAARLAAAEERLASLSAAGAELDQLRSPVTRTAHATAIRNAEQALSKLRDDRTLARAAIDRLRAAESEASSARLAHRTWHDDVAQAETAESERTRIADDLTKLRRIISELEAQEADIDAEAKALDERAAALGRDIAATRAAAEYVDRTRQRNALAERLAALQALHAEMTALSAALATNAVTDTAMKRLHALSSSRERLDQRLTAAAPEIAITPLADAAAAFKIDGKSLSDATALRVRRTLHIDIEGVGRITVTPGGGDTIQQTEAEFERVSRDLHALLVSLGAVDNASAEQAFEQRRADEQRLAEVRARLDALAPSGLEDVVAAHARLVMATSAPPSPPASDHPLEALQQHLAALVPQKSAAEQRLADLTSKLENARRELTKAETLLASHDRRLAELAPKLGVATDRAARTNQLDQTLAAAEKSLADAARASSAWHDAIRQDDHEAELQRRLAAARAADARDNERIRQLELDIRGWETALSADNELDIEHEAQAARHASSLATERLQRLKVEIDALKRLDTMLVETFAQDRTRIVEPVSRRIGPYLDRVFPGAALRMDETLSPSGLIRVNATETLDRVSRGTAEQIAVIARLGLARLLADRGAPAPLILDDALVYADDRRIEALFGALTDASAHHQVIVFTCRERTFERLPGHRLGLSPWRPSL